VNDRKQRKQLACIATLVLFGFGLHAQGADPVVLPDVHVTEKPAPADSRTGVPLKDLPQSIQVLPRAVIEEQKAYKLDEVLKNVSGIAIDNSRGFNEVFLIRGFRPVEGSVVLRDEFLQATDDLSPFAELANIIAWTVPIPTRTGFVSFQSHLMASHKILNESS